MGKQEQSEEYDQDVRDIIDSLKSKGLFDQFRKEFVADVDTKVCLILFFPLFYSGKATFSLSSAYCKILCFLAFIPESEAESWRLCQQISIAPNMESRFKQEPTQRQPQKTDQSVCNSLLSIPIIRASEKQLQPIKTSAWI